MRLPILSISLVVGALAAVTAPAAAQSATSYPWCSKNAKMDSGSSTCYYTSYQQCMKTISGLGGYCYESPYYHGSAAKVRGRTPR
jgi:Protein of unknown function (DUF3551)